MREIWKNLNGIKYIQDIELETWRIIEDQSKSYTRGMVDTAAEHEVLEMMIDESKPSLVTYGDENVFKGLHYLLTTPFRYPPLKKGSRFGSKTERNLFYSSLKIETAMSEKAYHRFSFLLASDGKIGDKTVNYTAFKTKIKTKRGLILSQIPFVEYREHISSPTSYVKSQELGKCMRESAIEAFISHSARCKNNGENINIFSPKAFEKIQSIEDSFQFFTCYSTKDNIEFYSNLSSMPNPAVFVAQDFYFNGQFPFALE